MKSIKKKQLKNLKLQIGDILDIVKEINLELKTILGGDLNCGPQTSILNYQTLLDMSFINELDAKEITWDPKNSLNKRSYHKTCPPQQIDHLLINQKLFSELRIKKWNLLTKNSYINLKSHAITLSDHYGVFLEIE